MHNHGFSFLEILLVLAITAVLYAVGITGINHYIYSMNATLTLNQIQTAVMYARSLAIRDGEQVLVYVNQESLLVYARCGSFRFKTFMSTFSRLDLKQSGFHPNVMKIEPNGLTYQNGHFHYYSQKSNAFPEFKLYFNKGLRFYTVQG